MRMFSAAAGEAERLLRIEVRNVGKAPVALNAEDVAPVACKRQQSVRAGIECVDNVVFARPELARRLAFVEGVNLGAFGKGSARVHRLQRLRLHHRYRDGADALHGKRRQGIAVLVADAGRVNRAFGGDGNRGDLAARRVEEYIALAFGADAVDKAGAVGTCDQIALGVPGQASGCALRRT